MHCASLLLSTVRSVHPTPKAPAASREVSMDAQGQWKSQWDPIISKQDSFPSCKANEIKHLIIPENTA